MQSFPLSVLLSQALVAFTIEFDNEAEHQLPHRTANFGRTSDTRQTPWLVSMAMWFNCMQYVTDDGITVRDVMQATRTMTNWHGMVRWGYISVAPPSKPRPKKPGADWIVRPTPGGRQAQQIWKPL